jgi:addiction module RelE/StbE family toxin
VIVAWTTGAIADRDAIFDYIEADNPHAAVAQDQLFSARAQILAQFPLLGRSGRLAGTRELVEGNFIMVYEIAGDAIRIIRVLHGARQWP